MKSTTQVLTHWSPTPRLPQSQNLRFALLWCNSTSNLHSSFYTYCPVEIWHEWYVELVVKWRPALTGVAAAADAVRRNGDGDGVLVVGRSHVIRRCLDFMRWLGKGERVPRTFLFFSSTLLNEAQDKPNIVFNVTTIEGGIPLLQFQHTRSMVPSFTLVSTIWFLVWNWNSSALAISLVQAVLMTKSLFGSWRKVGSRYHNQCKHSKDAFSFFSF